MANCIFILCTITEFIEREAVFKATPATYIIQDKPPVKTAPIILLIIPKQSIAIEIPDLIFWAFASDIASFTLLFKSNNKGLDLNLCENINLVNTKLIIDGKEVIHAFNLLQYNGKYYQICHLKVKSSPKTCL